MEFYYFLLTLARYIWLGFFIQIVMSIFSINPAPPLIFVYCRSKNMCPLQATYEQLSFYLLINCIYKNTFSVYEDCIKLIILFHPEDALAVISYRNSLIVHLKRILREYFKCEFDTAAHGNRYASLNSCIVVW